MEHDVLTTRSSTRQILPNRREALTQKIRVGPSRRLQLTYFLGFWSLTMPLVLSSGPASAEWVKSASAESEGGYTVWFDPDTIRRKGDLVKMWALYDFKTIRTMEGISYLSYIVQREYDCTEERIRYLAFTFFTGNMGSGKVVPTTSDEQQKSEPVQPDSIGLTLLKVACAKA